MLACFGNLSLLDHLRGCCGSFRFFCKCKCGSDWAIFSQIAMLGAFIIWCLGRAARYLLVGR